MVALLLLVSLVLGLLAKRIEQKPAPAQGGSAVEVHTQRTHEGALVGWIYDQDGRPAKNAHVELSESFTGFTDERGREISGRGMGAGTESGSSGRFAIVVGRDLFPSPIELPVFSALLAVRHYGIGRQFGHQISVELLARGCVDLRYSRTSGFVAPEVSVRVKESDPESSSFFPYGREPDSTTPLLARLIDGKPRIYDEDYCPHYSVQSSYIPAAGVIVALLEDFSAAVFRVPVGTTDTHGFIKGESLDDPRLRLFIQDALDSASAARVVR